MSTTRDISTTWKPQPGDVIFWVGSMTGNLYIEEVLNSRGKLYIRPLNCDGCDKELCNESKLASIITRIDKVYSIAEEIISAGYSI